MKKKIILCLLVLASIKSNSQEKIAINDTKFLISIHYTGNLRNDNFVSDNYNGILGLDAKYSLYRKTNFNIQAGLGLDYFKAREIGNQLNLKNSIIVNPNIGIVLESNKVFQPFFNLGYSFFTAKYTIQQSYNFINPNDPGFNTIPNTAKYNFDSVSINPGFRLFMNKNLYFQTDYKYLPIKSNINAHLISIGFGYTL